VKRLIYKQKYDRTLAVMPKPNWWQHRTYPA